MESSIITAARERRRRDPLIDTILNDRYRIEAEIGSGGMSTVYLAFDADSNGSGRQASQNRSLHSLMTQLFDALTACGHNPSVNRKPDFKLT